jgi:hypothetical protein
MSAASFVNIYFFPATREEEELKVDYLKRETLLIFGDDYEI